jgi:hypothetical protein
MPNFNNPHFRCPNPDCVLAKACMKFDGDPPMCHRSRGESFDPQELKRYHGGPGHYASEEDDPTFHSDECEEPTNY